jgi:hypothetical protein
MRLNETPLLPLRPESEFDTRLYQALNKVLREIAIKTNQIAAGNNAGFDAQSTAVPSAGSWAIGDFVKKSNPVVAGGGGSQYVITGWVRITNGSGNILNTDWIEHRVLTGT